MQLWVALALGILNPLACLVHCAPSHAEVHAALGMPHGEFFGFLCSVPQSVNSAAQAPDATASTWLMPDPSGTPRAVFACALVLLWLLPALRLRRHDRYAGRPRLQHYIQLPLLPPPRSA